MDARLAIHLWSCRYVVPMRRTPSRLAARAGLPAQLMRWGGESVRVGTGGEGGDPLRGLGRLGSAVVPWRGRRKARGRSGRSRGRSWSPRAAPCSGRRQRALATGYSPLKHVACASADGGVPRERPHLGGSNNVLDTPGVSRRGVMAASVARKCRVASIAAAISLEPTLRGLRANNVGTCRGLSGILNAAERLQPS